MLAAAAACGLSSPGRAGVVGHDCSAIASLDDGSVRVERYVPTVGTAQPRIAWLPHDPPPRTLADARLYVILRPPSPDRSARAFEVVVTGTAEAGRGPRWLAARIGDALAEVRLQRYSRKAAYARANLKGPAFEAAFAAGAPLEVFVLDRSGAVLEQRTDTLAGRPAALALATRLAAEADRKATNPTRLCEPVTFEE